MKYLIIVAVLVLLLMSLLFRRKPATLEAALEALEEERLQETGDMGGYVDVDGAQNRARFVNSKISIFYFMSYLSEPDRKVETIDFTINGFSGGYKITFANDKVVQWVHNAVETPRKVVNPQRASLAHKILKAAREAYNADDDMDVF